MKPCCQVEPEHPPKWDYKKWFKRIVYALVVVILLVVVLAQINS